MSHRVEGVGLAAAIEELRGQFETVVRQGGDADVQFPVQEVTVELRVVTTENVDGKAGFTVPFVGVELGGSMGRGGEAAQTVTVRFGAPVDRAGNPIKVVQPSAQPKG